MKSAKEFREYTINRMHIISRKLTGHFQELANIAQKMATLKNEDEELKKKLLVVLVGARINLAISLLDSLFKTVKEANCYGEQEILRIKKTIIENITKL